MTLPSSRRLNAHYIALQSGFWAMFAAICGFQAALLQARGFSSSQIGALIAVRCLAGIVFQPLLGSWADRHPQVPLKRVVNLSLGFSLLVGLWFTLRPGMGFVSTAVVFTVLGGFEISAYPLCDAMAVQFIRAGADVRYSLGRGVGSLSYAVTCVLLGLQAGRLGVESTLVTHAVLVGLEMVFVQTFPAFPAQEAAARAGEAAPPRSALAILRENPRFALMLLAILLSLTGVLPLSNFLVNILQAKGGGQEQLGLGLFLMAAAELPGSLLFARLLHRGTSSGRLLLVSMVFMALKALCLLLAPSVAWLLLLQPVQMMGYGVFTPASVYYVSESVPAADQVKGQTLMMVASNGLGGMLGGILGGRMLDLGAAAGAGAGFLLWSCLACTAAGALLGAAALGKKN